MILDDILESKNSTTANPWIDMILEYQKKDIFTRYKKKYQLYKISKSTTPSIDVIVDMAETIQLLGKYLLYNNNKDTAPIASYKRNKSNIIVFPINEKENYGLKCILDITHDKTVKMTIMTSGCPKEIQFNASWNEESISSVIKHKYDEYIFEHITNILMKRFFGLIISYI